MSHNPTKRKRQNYVVCRTCKQSVTTLLTSKECACGGLMTKAARPLEIRRIARAKAELREMNR